LGDRWTLEGKELSFELVFVDWIGREERIESKGKKWMAGGREV
jgi:hypothetical protein